MHTRSLVAILPITGLVLAFGAPALAQTIQFDPGFVGYPDASKEPSGLAAGDFNEDGIADLIKVDPEEMEIQVFLGVGNGTFTKGFGFGSVDQPAGVTVADINRDGHADLVMAGLHYLGPGGHVLVATGNGDGTFQTPAQPFETPDFCTQIVAADLNNDGWPDAVTAGNCSAVQVLLNDGHGQLVAQAELGPDSKPRSVAVGDFNGDHALDVAITSTADFTTVNNVTVFLGHGDGTFAIGTSYSTPNLALSVAAGDITGDGNIDLVVSQEPKGQGVSGLDVFAGNGDGSFRAPVLTPVPHPNPFSGGGTFGLVLLADLNQDGRLDAALAGGQGMLAFAGDVEGNLEAPIDFSLDGGPLAVLADLNGDGKVDGVSFQDAATFITVALNSTPPVALGPSQPVAWINPVNVSITGASLQKSGGCDGCFDASAASQQAIDGSLDSGVRFIAAHDPLLAVGLSTSAGPTSLEAIDFAIRPQAGYAEVRELGVYKKDIAFAEGDEFRILIQGTTVRYLRNGDPFYVSTVAPAYPLHAAALIASAGGAVSDAELFGAIGSGGDGGGGDDGGGATWGSTQNVTIDGTRLAKTSGCDGCYDASAIAAEQIDTDGFFEFTVDDTAPLLIAGLTPAFTSGDPSSIQFGVRLQGGDAEIREGGVYKTDVLFHTGDVFRIAVTGGLVTYALNGTVFYTSESAAAGPLFAAVAFASVGASLDNATIGASAP